MKKLLICLLSVVLGLSMFSCKTESDVIKVYMPDGAPALALAKLMHDDAEINGRKFQFIVVDSSTISTYLTSDSADFAIVPTNVAANLYNKGKDYRLAAGVTHGNLYIVGKSSVAGENISERLGALKGKTVGVIGQAAVPAMTFKYIMKHYDITHNVYNSENSIKAGEISVRYFGNGADAMRSLKLNEIDFALLGEPAVAGVLKNVEGSSIALNLCDIWADITEGDGLYPQACLVTKGTMDSALITALIEKMKEGESWAEDNPEAALTAVSSHMLEGTATTITALDKATVQRCNIKIIPSGENKGAVNIYLNAIMSVDSDAVGGKLPDGNFYV